MAPDDLMEEMLAFLYSTTSGKDVICPVCGAEMEESADGTLKCPECDDWTL